MLYCDIYFIAVVWNGTHNISKVCLWRSRLHLGGLRLLTCAPVSFEIFPWFCKCPWDKCFRVYLSLGLDFSPSVSCFLANLAVLLGTVVCVLPRTHTHMCSIQSFQLFSREGTGGYLAQLEKLLFKVVLCIRGPCIPRKGLSFSQASGFRE